MRYEAGEMRDLSFIPAELHDTSIARLSGTLKDILLGKDSADLFERLSVPPCHLPAGIVQADGDYFPLLKIHVPPYQQRTQ